MGNFINPVVVVSAAPGTPPGTTINEAELHLDTSTGTLYALRRSNPTATRIGPNAAGSGSVTNNEGTLVLGQLVIGNGGADEQTLGSYGISGQVLTSAGPSVAPVWANSTAPNFSGEEVPSGNINGVNVTFTLVRAPNPSTSLHLFLNGLRLHNSAADYTISGSTITMTSAPSAGDILLADYRF